VLAPNGEAESTFTLGDGVQDVQVSRAGRIWVSYQDEGVFGNYGWGAPNGPAPLGSAGLVCWDTDGTKVWDFVAPDGLPAIADCYAMNVSDEAAWACYYTDFPIARVWGGFRRRRLGLRSAWRARSRRAR
jgi:hypothetical protein